VLAKEVDAVSPEALQHLLDDLADVVGAAISLVVMQALLRSHWRTPTAQRVTTRSAAPPAGSPPEHRWPDGSAKFRLCSSSCRDEIPLQLGEDHSHVRHRLAHRCAGVDGCRSPSRPRIDTCVRVRMRGVLLAQRIWRGLPCSQPSKVKP
jgi:hypothetical protein